MTENKISISIVSHGHSKFVLAFARQLAAILEHEYVELIITVNSAMLDDLYIDNIPNNSRLKIILLKNTAPCGFGANHNFAFKQCTSDFFCVVNPDIELLGNPFSGFVNTLKDLSVGLTYPSQVDAHSISLDYERDLVKPISIWKRHLLGQINRYGKAKEVHWISGAFMVFKSSVFRELNGFDERYFMYCEDVDICLRLQLAGYTLARADAKVIHHTQRQTLKNPKHLAWHIRSLLRLWNSPVYKRYKKKLSASGSYVHL